MEIITRKTDKYLDVKLKHYGLTIEIGLLDEKERKELALILLSAVTELLSDA